MKYMGSKSKYCKYIVPILQESINKNNIKIYIEPFVGGANVIDKIDCKIRIGFDKNKYLIALLEQSKNDFSKIPKICSKEDWNKAKDIYRGLSSNTELQDYEIGAYCFLASYNNGGFSRGFANSKDGRNYYNEAYQNLSKQSSNLKNIIFNCKCYEEIDLSIFKNCLFYLDPPYKNTKTYGYKNESMFDYDFFWDWVRKLSKNNVVFISEQSAPKDFSIVWEKEVIRSTNKNNNFKAVEKLFTI